MPSELVEGFVLLKIFWKRDRTGGVRAGGCEGTGGVQMCAHAHTWTLVCMHIGGICAAALWSLLSHRTPRSCELTIWQWAILWLFYAGAQGGYQVGRVVNIYIPHSAVERVWQTVRLPELHAASSPAHDGAEGPARVRPLAWAAWSVKNSTGPGSSLCHSRLALWPQRLCLYLSFVVLVQFYNKIPHWMALKTYLFLIVERLGSSRSGRLWVGRLARIRFLVFCCILTRQRERALVSSSPTRALILFVPVPVTSALLTCHLPKAPAPHTITLGIRTSANEFGGADTQ